LLEECADACSLASESDAEELGRRFVFHIYNRDVMLLATAAVRASRVCLLSIKDCFN